MAGEQTPKAKAETVKMKYLGHFRGTEKVVALPIPLIANSQRLEQTLAFTRSSDRQGPAFCDVPMEWVGALMTVGGNWQVVDTLSPELLLTIKTAQAACDQKMRAFSLDNELVSA